MKMKGAKVKVADRLAEIVLSLYQGEVFSADIIRQRFDVDMRTAYRDLNRLGSILEDVGEGKKRLSSQLKGEFNVNDLLRITKHTGISAFYPWHELKNHNQSITLPGAPGLLARRYSNEKSPLRRALFYSSFDEKEDYGGVGMKIEAQLQASAPVAVHFKECNLLPYQRIIKEFDNGDLLLTSYIDSPEQLFPLVQYWIPHLIIISPQIWQSDLKERITAWCNVT